MYFIQDISLGGMGIINVGVGIMLALLPLSNPISLYLRVWGPSNSSVLIVLIASVAYNKLYFTLCYCI